ncbi:hypothetical protein thalar_00001 [Litoreibacter arenae DSM 19593]|uniref:Uncharacterized protein n=1 Tax=Litoreibacter arenae DSM 19593 TaxID=1123360 RepID=S9RVF0_9RHOB|nr:hypothetical protein thalar_00001 [Litoreibacter arenae DSM 19593]
MKLMALFLTSVLYQAEYQYPIRVRMFSYPTEVVTPLFWKA